MKNNNPALSMTWLLNFYLICLLFLLAILMFVGIGAVLMYAGIVEKSPIFFAIGFFLFICAIIVFVRGFLAEIRIFKHINNSPLTSEKQFALAVSAILTETNKQRHDCIHGERPGLLLKACSCRILRGSWNIKNSKQLVETLQWLSEGGHRSEYEAMYKAISSAWPISDAFQLLDENHVKSMKLAEIKDFQRQFDCILKNRTRFSSILAWDLCRLVSVARWGVGAELISEDEAWEWILGAARRLREEFGSWKELGENYLVGRYFSGFTNSLAEKAYKKLLKANNVSSPWNRITWFPAVD